MKKKIAIIENNIIATNTIRRKLTSELMQHGYDVIVLTTGTETELQLARDRGFSIVDVKSSNSNPIDILKYMLRLRKAIRQSGATLCLTFTIRPAIWGNLITAGLKIPTITNITGIGPLFASKSGVYLAARKLYRFALRKTARIFFQNEDDRDLFVKNNFIDPTVAALVPGSGVDHVYFAPMVSQPPHSSQFQFLFISRLVKDKGILEYVAAARQLKQHFPNVTCRILGPLWLQNLKANIVSQAELDSWIQEGVIEYLGEAVDVRPFIAEADCIVLPSYREGTSNVLLEASRMEKPCITCDATGCREIVSHGKTGFLCRVKDADDLADKMKQMLLLSPDERIAMGKAAREKVILEFDKQIVINAYLKAIKELI